MFPRLVAASLLTLLSPIPAALAMTPAMVKSVDVQITLADLTNAQAATRFSTVELDLENAIAARLIDRIDEQYGVEITIDISELELSNSFTDVFNLADTKLGGNVKVKGSAEYPVSANYDMLVDVNAALPFMPEGTVIETLPGDSAEYYSSVVTAFADAVVRKLDE